MIYTYKYFVDLYVFDVNGPMRFSAPDDGFEAEPLNHLNKQFSSTGTSCHSNNSPLTQLCKSVFF